MICKPCGRGADIVTNAIKDGNYTSVVRNLARVFHEKECPGETQCDCQHRLPKAVKK